MSTSILYRKNVLKELQEIAESKGGKCLSTEYLGCMNKLEFMCEKGHIWSALPISIKSGTWCKKCATIELTKNKIKNSLAELQKILHEKNGKCLSEYINNTTKLEFECNKGHKWMASPKSIKSGTWCHECKYNKK